MSIVYPGVGSPFSGPVRNGSDDRHSKNWLPDTYPTQLKPKKSLDIISITLAVLYFIPALALTLSPRLSKRAATLAQKKALSSKSRAVIKKLADIQWLQDKCWQALGLTGFLYALPLYQIGFETQQPSKLLGSTIWAVNAVGLMLKPKSTFIKALSYLGSIFWLSGERNDIQNSLHPENRHELNWLHSTGQHVLEFIHQDLKLALAPQVWKELWTSFSNPESWKKQNASHMAVGVQLSMLGWVSALLSIMFKRSQKKLFQNITLVSNMVAATLVSIPVMLRAWQSRRELDGQITLIGLPLMAVGRGAVSAKTPELQGIGWCFGVGRYISIGRQAANQ